MRARYGLGISLVGALLVGGYVAISTYRPPSCTDGVRNQDEAGVDCGGVCTYLCASQTEPLRVVWTRLFEVAPGWWSAMAYVENPNAHAVATRVPYRFRLFEQEGVSVREEVGTTFIRGEPLVPIFVGRINVGSRVPYRVTFDFPEDPFWQYTDAAYQVTVLEQTITTSPTQQVVAATLRNDEPRDLERIVVNAIVFDDAQNAIAASETYVDRLPARGKRGIRFTWPNPFSESPKRVEVVPRVPVQP